MIKIEQNFDILGRYKRPKLKLCNPNRKGQGFIFGDYDLQIKRNFNQYDEMTFKIDWLLDGKENPLYNKILGKKVIYAGEEFGYWYILDAKIYGDGINEYKTVDCVSGEIELAKTKLNKVEDTIRLYNPLDPTDESTLLGYFLKCNKLWRIGTVDSELWEKYRTFDVQTTDWYNFLINDVEEKFLCIFEFDNINRIVHCRTPEKATRKTNIFISNGNLLDNFDIEEKAEEVYTALDCYGAKDLDIRSVNPIGTNIMYNWDFYKSTEWISQNLIEKINIWEEKFHKHQKSYADCLRLFRAHNINLTELQTGLTEINSKIQAVEQALGIAISVDNKQSISGNQKQKNDLLTDRITQEAAISRVEGFLANDLVQMKAINTDLAFENNFTPDEINELDSITYINTYKNDAFFPTDKMTPVEIQDETQELYDHCTKILEKVSMPKYYFSAQLINFVFLKEYEKFTKQFDVGSVITCEIRKGWRTPLVVLSYTLNFDDQSDFPIEFSNRHRLDNGMFEFNDLFSQTSYSSGSFDYDKALFSEPVKSGLLQEVNSFMNGNFDAAKNTLMCNSGFGSVIDGSGYHGRQYIDGVLQPHELWMTQDMIALSDDNFNSVPKTAIGRFKLPNSENYGYGVNAEFLAGKLLVGNQFLMEAENGSFKFDGSGASLYNANFEVIDKNNIRRIIINPNEGFKIQSRHSVQTKWEDKIYLDNDGNGVFVGTISADRGVIGGWDIINTDEKRGLYSDYGDFISADGTGKLGLLSYTRNSATFKGNIYAYNLDKGGFTQEIIIEKFQDNSIPEDKLSVKYSNKIVESQASIKLYADNNFATIQSLTQFKTDTTNSISAVRQYANNTYATKQSLTQFTTNINKSISEISQTAKDGYAMAGLFASVGLGGKVTAKGSIIVEAINDQSTATIEANRINFKGFATFVRPSDLAYNGTTVIDGGRIRTGTIDANVVNVTNLNANNIKTGTISGNIINGGTINGANINWGNYNHLYTSGNDGVWESGRSIKLDAGSEIRLIGGYGGLIIKDNTTALNNNGGYINLNAYKINLNAATTATSITTNSFVFQNRQVSRQTYKIPLTNGSYAEITCLV